MQYLNLTSIRPLVHFIVYSNSWIGLGAFAMAWLSSVLLGIEPNIYLLLFVFFSTKLTYTFQRYVKILKEDRVAGDRLSWMIKHRNLVTGMMVLDLCLSIWFLFSLDFERLILYLVPSGIVAFYYAWKLPLGAGINLRDIPTIKIFLISLVWAGMVTLLPVIQAGILLDSNVFFVLTTNFLFVFSITIPFDIRDIYLDEPRKKTIPQLSGINTAKGLATFLAALSGFFFAIQFGELNFGLIISILITLFLILKSTPEKNELYFSFYIDGLLILLPFFVFLTIWSKVYIQ